MFHAAMFRIAIICTTWLAANLVNAQEALPAARVGDATASGGVIITGESSVLINGRPAAREADLTTNPSIQRAVPGVGGIIRSNGRTGANDRIVTGASNVFIGGNVIINGQRAATAAPPQKPASNPITTSQSRKVPADSTREMVEFCGEQIVKFFQMVYSMPNSTR